MEKNYLIVIGGPTAVGKTALAIKLAKYFNTQILSADSRQFYKGMDIGTAKPSAEELSEVKHFFIDNLDISQDYSIGDFEKDAISCLDKVYSTHKIAILVGGSGMYIRALCEGLDEFPEVSEEIKTNIENWEKEFGFEFLQNKLQELDNESFNSIDIQNVNRVKRALSVTMCGENPFFYYKNKPKTPRNFHPIYIALDEDRQKVYDKINLRVDKMIELGLEQEVKSFIDFQQKNALQTVGYQEFFDYFNEKINYQRAVELIKQHSRNYAKRQLTWFRNQSNFTFFSPNDEKKIIEFVENQMKVHP